MQNSKRKNRVKHTRSDLHAVRKSSITPRLRYCKCKIINNDYKKFKPQKPNNKNCVIHSCTHARMHAHTYTHAHTCMHTHAHTHTHTHIHTHTTHTHTLTRTTKKPCIQSKKTTLLLFCVDHHDVYGVTDKLTISLTLLCERFIVHPFPPNAKWQTRTSLYLCIKEIIQANVTPPAPKETER